MALANATMFYRGLGDSNSNIGTSCTESCSRLRAARPGDCNLGALPLLLPCGSGAAEVHEFRVHLVYRRLPACKGSGTRLVPTEPCWRLPVCISRTWNWLSAQSGSALLLGRQVSAYADQGCRWLTSPSSPELSLASKTSSSLHSQLLVPSGASFKQACSFRRACRAVAPSLAIQAGLEAAARG